MRRTIALAGVAAMTMLTACGSGGAFNRDRPDEFLVSRSPPLVIPPDFNLTPPRPGEPQARGADTSTQMLQAMFGGPAQRSATEGALLSEAGLQTADPGIRSEVGDPGTQTVDYGATTQQILNAPEGDAPEAQVTTPQ